MSIGRAQRSAYSFLQGGLGHRVWFFPVLFNIRQKSENFVEEFGQAVRGLILCSHLQFMSAGTISLLPLNVPSQTRH